MAVAALIASHTAEEITPKITTTTQLLKRGVKFMLASACCTICETKIPKVAAIRECCFLVSDSFLLPTRSPHSGPYLCYRGFAGPCSDSLLLFHLREIVENWRMCRHQTARWPLVSLLRKGVSRRLSNSVA